VCVCVCVCKGAATIDGDFGYKRVVGTRCVCDSLVGGAAVTFCPILQGTCVFHM